MVTAAPLWLALGVASPRVDGTTACPTPAAVSERLEPLLPAGARPPHVRLEDQSGELRISLVTSDGTVIGERTIAAAHECDALADAAAVIIAGWAQETDEPALLAPRPVPGVGSRATPPAWDLGAGVGAALRGRDVVPAAVVAAGMTPPHRTFGLRALVAIPATREAPLPAGRLGWRRWALALGPSVRLHLGSSLAIDAYAGPAAAWLALKGSGFADNRSRDDLTWGVGGGARIGWVARGARPFLEAGASYWPSRTIAYELPDGIGTVLPRLELLLTLGIALGL